MISKAAADEKVPPKREGGEDPMARTKSGAVRIRVLVTQQELKQLINNNGGSSLEELLCALRLRSRCSVSLEGWKEDNGNGNWRPDLESIPED